MIGLTQLLNTAVSSMMSVTRGRTCTQCSGNTMVRVLHLDQIKFFGTSYSRMIALQSEAKSGHLNFEISIVSIIISYLHLLTSEDPVMRILKIERWGGQWILNVSSKVHKIPNIFLRVYTVRKYLQPSNVLSWVHLGGIKYPAGF